MSEIFSKILKDKNGKVLNVGSKYTQPDWGSEVAEVEILPQTSFGADTMSGTGWALSSPLLKSLEADKEYVVKHNGKEYTCTAFEVAYGDGMNVVCIGNGSELGDYGADVPFLLIEYPKTIGESEGVYGEIGSLDGFTYMTISIKAVEETIHKLPSKYVEGVGKYKQPEWGVEEGTPVTVVSGATVSVSYISSYGVSMGQATINTSEMIAGDIVTVIFDGVEYEFAAKSGMNEGQLSVGETNPFMLVYTPATGELQIVTTDKEDTDHTIAVSYVRDNYHSIPHDYLPNTAPRVLFVTADADGVTDVSASEVNNNIKTGGMAYLKIPGTSNGEIIMLPCVHVDGVNATFAGLGFDNLIAEFYVYKHYNKKITAEYPNYIDMEAANNAGVYRVEVSSSGTLTATKRS